MMLPDTVRRIRPGGFANRTKGLAALSFLAVGMAVASPATAQPLTLEEAISRADAASRANRAKQHELEGARYQHSAALADLGPKVNLSVDYQRWDSPIKFAIDLPQEMKDALGLGDFQATESVVREQNTYSASINVVQPLTPLLTMGYAAHLQKLNVDRARLAAVAERRKTRIQVIDAFYGILKLRETVRTLEALDKAATGHLEQATRFETVGMLKKDDVMRIQVQVETLRQQLDMARTGAQVQASSLALLVGMPVNAEIDPVEAQVPQDVTEGLDDCLAEALAKRPEPEMARVAVRMAEAARNLRITTWVPTVAGLVNFNQTNPTEFSRSKSWFVGLTAQWTPWDWGKTFFQTRAAHADLLAARQSAGQVEDLVRLEVKANWLAARTAKAGIERSARSVEQARENLRIQMERSRQNLNTTTDVLDAEALVLQAETEAAAAGYGWRVAREKLYDSMGR